MTVELPALVAKYHHKGVLLDSNLLVLLIIGLVDRKLVQNFKRTHNQGFTAVEFDLLKNLVVKFGRIITTPHLLTETSNYLGQLHGKTRESALQKAADIIQRCKERRPEAKRLVDTNAFFDFGLTDSAVLDLPPKKYLVLSVDAALVIALNKKGVAAINFNHLRELIWRS